MIMNEVLKFLKTLVKHDDTVVVAVSGGPDSMALLNLLIKLRTNVPIHIVCAHVHHNIRKESDKEKEFVETYCKNNDVKFEFLKIEKYHNQENFHQEARAIRYHFFEQIVNKYHAQYLMTAHHGDDLIETILMRLVRGSSLRGYSGFPKISFMGNYHLVRPLITVTRNEINEYLEINKIPYVLDASNQKDQYTRNRYRKYVVPQLKKENNHVNEKFLKFSEMILQSYEYINSVVKEKQGRVFDDNFINIEQWKKENSFLQRQIIQYVLTFIYKDNLDMINDRHVQNIQKFLLTANSNSYLTLPCSIVLTKEYDRALFEKKKNYNSYHYILEDCILLPNGYSVEKVTEEESDNNFVCRLDISQIQLPIIIRTKRNGDRMNIKGLNGAKKISDIFTDEKIPKNQREIWPIVTDSSGKVLWLPGLKKSQFDRTKNGKYDIILKYSLKKEVFHE